MSRIVWLERAGGAALIAGVLLFLIAGVLLFRGCEEKPSKVDRDAQTQVDSAPQWKKEAADSQQVLDSLALVISKVRADSAKVAGQIRTLRQRKDSLAKVTAKLQANLDSLPQLGRRATASDSSAHWLTVASGQGHVIRTMAEEITACRQGDTVYEGRVNDLERALSTCEHRSAILESQRNQAQLRLDRSVGLLRKQLEEKEHADDWNLPLGIHLPGWTKCVAIGGAGGTVGALVDQQRGAVLGAGSALVGCLVS
jgi:hypothetical protein